MEKVLKILKKDVTQHTVLSLAMFGLIVSSAFTSLGIATLGVEAQVAFAQNETLSQAAAVALGDNRPIQNMMPPMTNVSTTEPQPPMHEAGMQDPKMASSTMPRSDMASSTGMFCPKLERSIMRGGKDEATSTGTITQLQMFIANKYGLNEKDVVTGYFGSTTESYLKKFQAEQGITPAPVAGPLTRAAINKLCGPKPEPKGGKMIGSTSPSMGSSTPGMPPHEERMHVGSTTLGTTTPPRGDRPEGMSTSTRMMSSTTEPRHEHPTSPTSPKATPTVSYINNSSNAASVIEALNEIGSGYTKLFQATLSSIGL